jgi:hypothetical protein
MVTRWKGVDEDEIDDKDRSDAEEDVAVMAGVLNVDVGSAEDCDGLGARAG